jgi:hypothetical protein
MTHKRPNAPKELGSDELATRILNALSDRELTNDEVIELGDTPHHAATVLESLLATGAVKSYCGRSSPPHASIGSLGISAMIRSVGGTETTNGKCLGGLASCHTASAQSRHFPF